MDLTEKKLSGQTVYHGVIINVDLDKVTLPDGKTTNREVCRHPGAVAILPLNESGEVTLVRQYRYVFEQETLEIPAGKLNGPNEDPLAAARRELREETGLTAREIIPMGWIMCSPGILSEKLYLYLARELSQGDSDPDEDEFLNVVKMPLSQLLSLVMANEIKDSKTVVAAFKAAALVQSL